MRTPALALGLLLAAGFAPAAPAADAPATETLDLWPGKAPGETGEVAPEKHSGDQPIKSITKRLPAHDHRLPPRAGQEHRRRDPRLPRRRLQRPGLGPRGGAGGPLAQ